MHRPRRAGWLLLAAASTVLDLWSKGLWRYPERLDRPPVDEQEVLAGWLNVKPIWNVGGIWSLPLPQTLLLVATLLAVPALLVWLFAPARPRVAESLGKALVLGGACGNLYDRLRFGAVRDWIDVYFGSMEGFHWPTFNVADAALVVGIVVLVLWSFRDQRKAGSARGTA